MCVTPSRSGRVTSPGRTALWPSAASSSAGRCGIELSSCAWTGSSVWACEGCARWSASRSAAGGRAWESQRGRAEGRGRRRTGEGVCAGLLGVVLVASVVDPLAVLDRVVRLLQTGERRRVSSCGAGCEDGRGGRTSSRWRACLILSMVLVQRCVRAQRVAAGAQQVVGEREGERPAACPGRPSDDGVGSAQLAQGDWQTAALQAQSSYKLRRDALRASRAARSWRQLPDRQMLVSLPPYRLSERARASPVL